MADTVRIDKWLWAARFFRTRTLASQAVDTGKVEIDGVRPKPSRAVRVGDTVSIRKGPYEYVVEVLGISGKRGSARLAAELYRETEDSRAKRAEVAESMKAERAVAPSFEGRGRPTKKDRRELMRLVRKGIAGPRKPPK
ncbi:MAG: hypothetical protein KJO07_01960 [Deltaproteobacteria bacterium]|jgi:ribosome-associated heat shock protein Hsp15|nr:hypothetical protein [Deltaproteobacteria bacterium]